MPKHAHIHTLKQAMSQQLPKSIDNDKILTAPRE